MRSSYSFICEDCEEIFQIYTWKSHPFCPHCGDHASIRQHTSIAKGSDVVKTLKIRWTSEELEILEQVIAGKIRPHQAVFRTGRTRNSVMKKLKKLKDERRASLARVYCEAAEEYFGPIEKAPE